MTKRRTRNPALPAVSVADKRLAALLNKIKENIEIWSGARGDGMDRVVTHRELVALGLAEELPSGDTALAKITGERLGRYAVSAASLKDNAIATRAIAEQAVTIPVQAYTAAVLALSGAWQTLAITTIDSSGAPISLICAAVLGITSSNTTTASAIEVRVVREGGIVIWGPFDLKRVIASGAAGSLINLEEGFALVLQDQPGEGRVSYQFQARLTVTSNVTGSVRARSLLLLETKR